MSPSAVSSCFFGALPLDPPSIPFVARGISEKDDDGDDDELGGLTREELYERAQERDVPGRSSMSKKELIEALS